MSHAPRAGSSALSMLLARSDPGGLVYGAIVTAAVLVTAGGHESTASRVVIPWAVVLATYWLAHVYVHAHESQFEGDQRHLLDRAVEGARAEVAVLQGGIPAMVAFGLVTASGEDTFEAARTALYFTVFLLGVFGFLGARHAGKSVGASCGEAVGASLLGVVLVVTKTLLH